MPVKPFRLLVCLFIYILFACISAAAQYDEKDFTHYTVKDGLSDIYITSLQQDDQGYMWIGTDDGLNRFDGTGFKKFYGGASSQHLSSGSIWKIEQLGRNRMGILSRGGFHVLNTKDYSVKKYYIADSTALGPYLNSPWDVIELPGGRYAVSTATGFYVFNEQAKLLKRHDAYALKDIGNKRILYGRDFFRIAATKYILYVNEDGLALYDDSSKTFKEFTKDDEKAPKILINTPFIKKFRQVKFQMSPDEFIFISPASQTITCYNHASGKTTAYPLPPGIADSISWQSKIIKLNDSLLAVSSGVNGFHLLRINRRTGAINTDGI
jgi:Two component regulator propeller